VKRIRRLIYLALCWLPCWLICWMLVVSLLGGCRGAQPWAP
jgi:hypothetical protein